MDMKFRVHVGDQIHDVKGKRIFTVTDVVDLTDGETGTVFDQSIQGEYEYEDQLAATAASGSEIGKYGDNNFQYWLIEKR